MIIEIKNLEKKFKDIAAVNGVNLQVEEGDIFGLLGPNGAGKTTTIRAILGLIDCDKGEVDIYGKCFNNGATDIKKKMGYVPQDLAFYEELNAIDNVKYWGKLYGLRGEELKNAVEEALKFTGLWERRKSKSKTFSGGMKRRLNIACAIVHKPSILIMDEPTIGVDPQSRNNILDCIKSLNKNNTTVIYTSHYMEEIEAICNRVAIMDFGKVICSGKINEVIEENCSEHIISIPVADLGDAKIKELESNKLIDHIEVKEDVANIVYVNENDLVVILENLINSGISLSRMTIKKQNLESVFLKLTGKKLRD